MTICKRLVAVFLAAPLALLSVAGQARDLIETSHFAPPAEPNLPADDFSGTLTLSAVKAGHFDVRVDGFKIHPARKSLSKVPALSIDLVQHGSTMIPSQRGPFPGTHPDWEWIVQPGAIWQQTSGTVVSLPVALMERNANCIHNGLLRIDIDASGGPAAATLQIASETCAYFQFDLQAAPDVTFARGEVANAEQTLSSYEAERAARLPQQAISTLSIAGSLASQQEVPAASRTNHGLVLDGVHYVSDCPTRAGPYPFCDELVLPSYSWAKSIMAGIGGMRLEQLYPAVLDIEIARLVPSCAIDDWRGVTMADALGMVTGVYNSRDYDLDESSPAMTKFFLVERHIEKITIACQAFKRRADPGDRFVYRTGDTYIFGTAMNAFLRRHRSDPNADYYRDLVQPIWDRLQLSPLLANPRRTYDDVKQPFSGWGMVMTRGDLARIVQFLQNGGAINGEQLLDPAMMARALQRLPEPQGPRADRSDQRYANGFWAWNAGPSLDCDDGLWVPLMSGYGGLAAALMPSGATYYFVSDGGAYRWRTAARAINTIQPQCKGAS